jgi:hypothetical protein
MLTRRNTLLGAALLILVAAGGYLLSQRSKSTLSPQEPSNAKGVASTPAARSAASYTNSQLGRGVTGALPPSAAAAPAIGPTWRQVSLSKAELEAHPKYWMLGYSEDDMAWLNQHGYPSLEEEARLSQSSIEQLKALTESGNANASAHLGVRLADRAMKSGNATDARLAYAYLSQSLIAGGPYQAAKISEFFVELGKNRSALGELTAEQMKTLQTEWLPLYETARGLSVVHGDFAAVRMFNRSRDLSPVFGLPSSTTSIEDAMSRLANMNRARAGIGLAPYDLRTRPAPPGQPDILSFQPTNTVYIR